LSFDNRICPPMLHGKGHPKSLHAIANLEYPCHVGFCVRKEDKQTPAIPSHRPRGKTMKGTRYLIPVINPSRPRTVITHCKSEIYTQLSTISSSLQSRTSLAPLPPACSSPVSSPPPHPAYPSQSFPQQPLPAPWLATATCL
jgi:hypothetical protein